MWSTEICLIANTIISLALSCPSQRSPWLGASLLATFAVKNSGGSEQGHQKQLASAADKEQYQQQGQHRMMGGKNGLISSSKELLLSLEERKKAAAEVSTIPLRQPLCANYKSIVTHAPTNRQNSFIGEAFGIAQWSEGVTKPPKPYS